MVDSVGFNSDSKVALRVSHHQCCQMWESFGDSGARVSSVVAPAVLLVHSVISSIVFEGEHHNV